MSLDSIALENSKFFKGRQHCSNDAKVRYFFGLGSSELVHSNEQIFESDCSSGINNPLKDRDCMYWVI